MTDAADFTAAIVRIALEPGDDLALPVTVPSGSETGTWAFDVYRDRRRGTALITAAPVAAGQVLTLEATDSQIGALVPTGSIKATAYWTLRHTADGITRTWLKGPFIVDPNAERSPNGAQGLTVTIEDNTVTVTASVSSGGGGGGTPDAHASTHRSNGSDPIPAATSSIGGLLSASDKSKLDAIEAGATADMTATEIRTALLTVDGTGSGLDADLLDGQHASAFETAGAVTAHTAASDPHGDRAYAAALVAPLGPPVPVSAGGTGATTVDTARDALALLSPGSAAFEGAELRQWRAAWANRRSTPATVLLLSDSNGVGYYANTEPDRWARIMAATLQTANGQRQALGYQSKHSLLNYQLTWTSGGGTVTEVSTSGLGYGAVGPAANGGWIETTQTCDRFWIRYTAGTLIGRFEVTIDGGAPINVPAIAGTIAGGYTWDSGALSRGSHTIRITSADTTFASRIEGLLLWDGNGNTSGSQGSLSAADSRTGTGVRVVNGAKFGTQAATFAASSATTWWTDGLDRINPDLVVIAFGTNEVNAGTSTTTFKANLAAIVSRINTVMTAAGRPNPSYLFVVPHGTGADAATFLPYRTAIIEAAATAGAALVDRYALFGYMGTAAADTYGFSSALDASGVKLHLNQISHRLAGEQLADYLLRSVGHRPAGLLDTDAVPYWQLPAASGSAQGAMSSADFTKLAGVATSATANPTIGVAIPIACSDETTALTTGTAKVTFRMPHAMTLTAVRSSLSSASSSGLVTVDINEGGASVLSTKLSIDQGELTSTTAATAAVISDATLADDAEVTIDIDAAGTNAKGLKVYLIGTRVP